MSRLFVDGTHPLIADASSLINLHACKVDDLLLSKLPHSFIVSKNAADELERGRKKGYADADKLFENAEAGLLTIKSMSDFALGIWESLICGEAYDTLDDGEAATLALAVEHSGIALIDEQKALRIAKERFPEIEVVSTVGLLLHPDTTAILGKQGQTCAIFCALTEAKMNVPAPLVERVAALLGPEMLRECRSIPGNVRKRYCDNVVN